jgi:ABC-type bacteriocin/lantibiotic exporter with double-glycine peptidase domain
MLLAFYGQEYSERELRILFKTRPGGTSAANIMIRLPELEFGATVFMTTYYELEQTIRSGTPCIVQLWTEYLLYWDESWMHDVVVVGFDEGSVLVNDPAFPDAPKEIQRDEFLAAWTAADRLLIQVERL